MTPTPTQREAFEQLVQEFGEDFRLRHCPTCLFPSDHPRPAHDQPAVSVTCTQAGCDATWALPPKPPPPAPTAADTILAHAQRFTKPGVATTVAQHAVRQYIETSDPAYLRDALALLVRIVELLTLGQREMAQEIADLNHRLPDLDTANDPVAPPAPGVEPPKREPLTAKTKVALAAQAEQRLKAE